MSQLMCSESNCNQANQQSMVICYTDHRVVLIFSQRYPGCGLMQSAQSLLPVAEPSALNLLRLDAGKGHGHDTM